MGLMSSQMSTATIFAPSRARYFACDAPWPCPAPVMNATLFSSFTVSPCQSRSATSNPSVMARLSEKPLL